jgi:pimeloyl-ACP methyl ester carboxylesterase
MARLVRAMQPPRWITRTSRVMTVSNVSTAMASTAPVWFDAAVAQAPERSFVEVEGAKIETLAWGQVGRPGVMLLHGKGFHADLWTFVAPFLAAERRVAAISFSGMGGSDWRAAYDSDQHVREILAGCEATGLFAGDVKPILVGHSFGGAIALRAAMQAGERLRATIVVDSGARDDGSPRAMQMGRPHKLYPSLDAAVANFRLAPAQPCENPWLVEFVARRAALRVEHEGRGAWRWKFDPYSDDSRGDDHRERSGEAIRGARCPLAFLLADDSALMTPTLKARTRLLAPDAPYVEILASHHHLMLDQPVAFITALRSLLATL